MHIYRKLILFHYNRPFELRGHVTSFFIKNESYMIFPPKRLVGRLLNRIIVIWFFKPAPFC